MLPAQAQLTRARYELAPSSPYASPAGVAGQEPNQGEPLGLVGVDQGGDGRMATEFVQAAAAAGPDAADREA
jgi:hypothetical protein